MLPRPAPIAISRIEGRPAFEGSSSRRANRSVIGPGGVGSSLMAPTRGSTSSNPKYVQICHVLHIALVHNLAERAIVRSAEVMRRRDGGQGSRTVRNFPRMADWPFSTVWRSRVTGSEQDASSGSRRVESGSEFTNVSQVSQASPVCPGALGPFHGRDNVMAISGTLPHPWDRAVSAAETGLRDLLLVADAPR